MQLYFDFSGYSDMAIGLARMFNIELPLNFWSPYKAGSIIEFWRRWHMTLSRFLRDYVYIPLGGNRGGEARRYRNLLLTMLVGGIWHGAGWTYVIWGALHGTALAANHLWDAMSAGPVRSLFYRAGAHLADAAGGGMRLGHLPQPLAGCRGPRLCRHDAGATAPCCPTRC